MAQEADWPSILADVLRIAVALEYCKWLICRMHKSDLKFRNFRHAFIQKVCLIHIKHYLMRWTVLIVKVHPNILYLQISKHQRQIKDQLIRIVWWLTLIVCWLLGWMAIISMYRQLIGNYELILIGNCSQTYNWLLFAPTEVIYTEVWKDVLMIIWLFKFICSNIFF